MTGGQFLTDVVRQVKRESVGVMAERLIDVADRVACFVGEVNRHVVRDHVASTVKFAEHVTSGH